MFFSKEHRKSFLFLVAFTYVFTTATASLAKSILDDFCGDGYFLIEETSASGTITDLAIDIEDYLGREIFIVTHTKGGPFVKRRRIELEIGDLTYCNKEKRIAGLGMQEFSVRMLLLERKLGENWRPAQKIIAKTMQSLDIKHVHSYRGKVRKFSDADDFYIEVFELSVWDYSK